MLAIEVCHATPAQQAVIALDVPDGATLLEAIAASGILARFPQIDLRHDKVGVFGQPRALSDTVRAGDRVEIYRELSTDPKDLRHQRVEQARLQEARLRSQPRKPKG